MVTDANFPGTRTTHSGLVGFMLWSQSTNYIDNLKVYDILNPSVPDDSAPADSYVLENSNVSVSLDRNFPQALNYQLKSTGGTLYGGYPNAEHVAYLTDSINPTGVSYPATVTSFTTDSQKVTYR